MAATCVTEYRTIISCDGQFISNTTLILGPETNKGEAMAHVDDHGSVCTGMGVASSVPATCKASIETLYRWRDV